MAKASVSNLIISSLRGGMNDEDPEHLLPDDQCTLAENVEFFFSALGERRNGTAAMSLTGSGLDTEDAVVHLSQRFPTNDPTIGELWAVAAIDETSYKIAYRSHEDEWTPVTPVDGLDVTVPNIYRIVAQPYLNKHFFAYMSDDPTLDRLHVWDGTTLRRTGLAEPDAPVVSNTGSGTYATQRYFRVRFVTQDADGNVILRSEPSESTTFSPSGSGSGASIARPALIGEAETHWEIEASADDATFYRIATRPIATTTYSDTTADVIDYADSTLSEAIGEYLPQPAARFLLVDGDRLIGAGHFFDTERQSEVWWTPVSNDDGVGNDERLPLQSLANNRESLDNYEGGSITGLSQTTNGSFYIFKWSHIYQATRTGNLDQAYDIICLSKARGALPGSIVSGIDELGRPCVYFLDPLTGPSRIGASGIQAIHGMRRTWTRVNRLADGIISHGVYYPEKRQTHWWVAADSSNYPSLKLVLQVNQNRETTDNDIIRGWSLATGRIAEAYCSTIVNVQILDENGEIATIARRPYIGLNGGDLLQQCDLLSTDAGEDYAARIVTKPYILAGLLNKWGAMNAAILADASDGNSVTISCTRDFGIETNSKDADLTPQGEEELVIIPLDSLVMSSACSIQFEFTDPS